MLRILLFTALLAVGLLASASAQAPKSKGKQAPKSYPVGEKLVTDYIERQTAEIAESCLDDLTTLEAWEARREKLREQYLDMLGLWPLPPRTDLKPEITGTVEGEGFIVEKLHFQSYPGLYVTANFYLPAEVKGVPPEKRKKYPTVLYVCGHGNVVENGISYGSKVRYQYHPAWFATHGYACLILDTLQLSEIPGYHHGTHNLGWWWWQTRGYTPAGIECWNAMRALDYLETRPEVDADKIGVTGRSGGGATSWWIAAADERIQAAVPVAGMTDLYAYVVEAEADRFKAGGTVPGHCDCMFIVNTHRWDFPMIGALIAPRPLLLGNSDKDAIFPVGGYRRHADKIRQVYALYDAEEKFQLLETEGPHQDTPELRIGINKWMNRWLKGDRKTEVEDDLPPKLTPGQLKVLEAKPEGALNDTIHEYFIKPASHPMPKSSQVAKEWWGNRKKNLLKEIRQRSFAGWPTNPPALKSAVAADEKADGVRLQAIDFTSEAGVELRLFVMTAVGTEPKEVVFSVLDQAGWEKWCRDLGPDFAGPLKREQPGERDDDQFAQNLAAMKANGWAFAAIAPRGVGPTQWADPGTSFETHTRRRFALLGQTVDGQRVWDVRRAIAALGEVEELAGLPITLQGEREAGVIGLYAGLYEPSVQKFVLNEPPTSHRDGPIFLNIARVLDTPQAVALAEPRPVTLRVKADQKGDWSWPIQLQELCGQDWLTVRVAE